MISCGLSCLHNTVVTGHTDVKIIAKFDQKPRWQVDSACGVDPSARNSLELIDMQPLKTVWALFEVPQVDSSVLLTL